MLTDNLRDQKIQQLLDRVRALETRSPLRSSSITEGRLRVGGSAVLLIDSDGGLIIQGSLDGDGNFEWTGAAKFTGTLTVAGPTEVTGNLTAKGTTRFEGDTTQQGPFHIVGATDLTGTMSVKPGGKVIVEGTSAATLQNGELSFATGGKLLGSSGGAVLNSGVGTGSVSVSGSNAQIGSSGLTAYIIVTPTGITAVGPATFSGTLRNSGMPTSPVSSYPGGFVNAVVADSSGNLRRLVAG